MILGEPGSGKTIVGHRYYINTQGFIAFLPNQPQDQKNPFQVLTLKELKTLGDHLRKKRLDLKLLQREVTKRLGVNPTSIYNWENNTSTLKVSYIPRIVEFLGYAPYNPSCLTFGQKIAVWRQSLGHNRRRLARYLRIDPGTLRRWERGQRQPQGKFLKKITRFFSSYPSDG